jgi:hypothetical protein
MNLFVFGKVIWKEILDEMGSKLKVQSMMGSLPLEDNSSSKKSKKELKKAGEIIKRMMANLKESDYNLFRKCDHSNFPACHVTGVWIGVSLQ